MECVRVREQLEMFYFIVISVERDVSLTECLLHQATVHFDKFEAEGWLECWKGEFRLCWRCLSFECLVLEWVGEKQLEWATLVKHQRQDLPLELLEGKGPMMLELSEDES